jgi:hypothetical protein
MSEEYPFTHTKAAWPEWEKENNRLSAKLTSIKTMSDFENWEKLRNANDSKLQEAFYEDTKEYNSLHHCRLVSPQWLYKTIIKKETKSDE